MLPAADGELGRYGLGYGATTWRGSGLYTQLFALHLLLPFLGVAARALDTGRRRATAALLLALTALSHIVFGYVAGISAFVLAVVGEPGGRARRLVRLATLAAPAVLLLLWFVVPLLAAAGEVNHSRWEDAHKWDSLGAPRILREIATGSFFDAGRPPVLSLVLLVGLGSAIAAARRDALARRLLALAAVWLLLFFGRATWGHLLLLAGVPRDLHLHRLQAAFELSAILGAAFGIERLLRWAMPRRALLLAGCAALLALLFPAILERARYLRQQVAWGTETLAAGEAARPDLDAALGEVRAILAERPGKVTAGKAATWGGEFKIGSVPVYALLAREHLPSVSFLYHSMSLPSDVMVLRDESDAAHDVAFGVRAAIAPVERPAPGHWRLRRRYGRFAVYETSPEGYFGLVDIGAVYRGPRAGWYDTNSAWLGSPLLRQGIVAALGDGEEGLPGAPTFGRWEPFPPAAAPLATNRGRVVAESKQGEVYRARLDLVRPCYAFVKTSFHPGLAARVDGRPAPIVRVTPGFGAVPVSAGVHEIEVRYDPGSLKALLFVFGLVAFAVSTRALGAGRVAALEARASDRLAAWGARLTKPRAATAAALAIIAVLALRPLFRGRLIDGHDATAYPPRLVEMAVALGDGQLPPVWAPDLANGHGQPLFQFAPPLLYFAALPLRLLGAGLTDSLQLALAALHGLGAAAIYRVGRRLRFARAPSLGAAVLWLFAPYVALDLYVRAAFAEAAAVACAPLALLAVLAAVQRPTWLRIAAAGTAVALLPLAHAPAALLLLPALAVAGGTAALAADPGRRGRAAAAGAAAIGVGLALSAYFWLPALMESDFVKIQQAWGDFPWRDHAVTAGQLLWSKWDHGFSASGSADGMSFAIGPLHLA
ncbi:MAG TPA: 6-pyruvoyl-tetrahydropterin synthase-related protein, partial [Thermoanaerobaculia bacterium]|nr:6-pyruvoyl-tetrahydropterin synthase-related protein [Thermoanaerobaculia bacterium]